MVILKSSKPWPMALQTIDILFVANVTEIESSKFMRIVEYIDEFTHWFSFDRKYYKISKENYVIQLFTIFVKR